MSERIDLGRDHWLEYTSWAPDRELNPQFADLPDVEKFGATVGHKKPDGSDCSGAVTFDGDVQRRLVPEHGRWKVVSWEPLTLEPSLQCGRCPDHGHIREGRWVPA